MTAVEDRLSLDWELWVVEQLLFTARRAGVVELLVAEGLSPEVAGLLVDRIERSAGLRALRARLGEATLSHRLEQLRTALLADQPVPVLPELGPDALFERHWVPGRPVKLTEVARGVRAVQRWSLGWLAERFGDARLDVNVERGRAEVPSATERLHRTVRLGDLVSDFLSGAPSNDRYVVSRDGWLADPQLRPLWDDLSPLPALLAPPEPPAGVAMWVGPAGTLTPAHFDPHNVLLVQVQGRKVVRLAPRLRARDHRHLDGHYLTGPLDAVFGPSVRSVALDPGEALFLPAGWFHEVTALDPSITLSFLSFPWPNHFHFLGPTGSDDR